MHSTHMSYQHTAFLVQTAHDANTIMLQLDDIEIHILLTPSDPFAEEPH